MLNTNNKLSTKEIRKMVNDIIKHIVVRGYEKEDLKMEGILEGIKAVNEYNPEYGTKLSSYVYGRIKFRILQLIRYTNAQKRMPEEQISLEATVIAETGDFYGVKLISRENQEEDYLNKERLSRVEVIAKKVLTKEEMGIFKLYIKGYNAKEISRKTNGEYKKVANKLAYIKKKVREEYLK